MKRTIISVIASLAFLPSLMAADKASEVVVHLRDGSYRTYVEEDLRRIDMDGDDVVVKWGDSGVDRYARVQVSRINFRGDTTVTSVEQMEDASGIVVKISDGKLTLNGLKSVAEAFVWDMSGGLAMSSCAVDNGCSIDISSLSAGVYVVELSNGQSFKFMKR